MKNNKSFLKQAEQNVVNDAKYCQDVLHIIDALRSFTYQYMDKQIDGERYKRATDGLNQFRDAIYDQLNNNLARCFMFSGVGGEEAAKYSQEKFKEHFNEENRYAVMHFLTKGGYHPHCWSGDTENKFRKEAQEKIKEMK
jgi:hypothetical protein